jgi:hypothetical protein
MIALLPHKDFPSTMADRKRILLVFFEGLPDTVIDTQVLLHARAAQDILGVDFEIWTFACSKPLYESSMRRCTAAERLAGCPVSVFRGLRPGVPGSKLVNRWLVARHLAEHPGHFDVVHARNDYTAAVVGPLARRRGIPLVWDCRGNSVAQFDEAPAYVNLPSSLKRLRIYGITRERVLAARDCSAALFVAHALADLCVPLLEGKPFRIIPCVARDELFFYDPDLRRRTRAALGYKDGERVFVYSGGLKVYQCFPEMISLFLAIRSIDGRARFLVVTPDIDQARALCASIDNSDVQLHSAAVGEVNAYLNAADAAVMLRAPSAINTGAFPTKFAEYCLAGLPVVMDDNVPDCAVLAKQFGNRLWPEPARLTERLDAAFDRTTVMNKARSEVTQKAAMSKYAALYGLAV